MVPPTRKVVAMLVQLLISLLGLLFPNAPAWLAQMLSLMLPVVVDAVHDLAEAKDMTGAAKFQFIATSVRNALDEGLDEVPAWKDYPEDRRDVIVNGIVEMSYFVYNVSKRGDGSVDDVKFRRVMRKARRSIAKAVKD